MQLSTNQARSVGHCVSTCLVLFWFVVDMRALSAAEFIDIEIALEDGRFYRLHQFYRECNEKLGGNIPLESVPDRRIELTPAEQALLLLAGETGIVRVKIGQDHVTLRVPDGQDDRVRKKNRRRLERLLGVSLSVWPSDKGLHLPQDFDPTKRTIVLVHGLEAGLADLEAFRLACRDSSIQPLLFDYPNDGPLAWSGDQLSRELKSLSSKHPRLRVAIVAHSMGGLVARQAIEAPGNNPGCVTDLFTLGTPHQGSELAKLGNEWLEMLFQPIAGVTHGVATLQDGLGEATDDLQSGSLFLKRLNQYGPARGVRYYALIGNRSFFTRDQFQAIDRHLRLALERHQVSLSVRTAVLALLSSDELGDGTGDGVVSISSARLKYATTNRVFPCNHLELLSLRGGRPEEHDVFRWIVNTLGWQQRGGTNE